jgi:glycerol kinase
MQSSTPSRSCGFHTDPSTASRTQLGAPAWDSRLLEIFGIPEEALPPIVDTVGEIGTLHHASWPCDLPLRARCVDQQAALAGAGCVEAGRTKATYGTGVFVLAHVGGERPEPTGGLLPTVAWSVGGEVEWALDGGVFTAGALLEWLSRDLGLAADPAALGGPRSAVVAPRRAGGRRGTDGECSSGARRASGTRVDRVARCGRRRSGSRARAGGRPTRGRRTDA